MSVRGVVHCTVPVLFGADQMHTDLAVIMCVNAWGTLGDRVLSPVIMCSSMTAGDVVDGAFSVSTKTAISLCGGTLQDFMTKTGTGSTGQFTLTTE